MKITSMLALAVVGAASVVAAPAMAQQAQATFFVTSVGLGKGADLGGLEGADAHCGQLAAAAGITGKAWRAYLSTQAVGGAQAVNARDRIGKGPWVNTKGEVIAKDVDDLHAKSANLTKQSLLSEKGTPINGRGDQPNTHDVLTGSTADGRAFPPGEDKTCGNWTKSGTEGAAMLGHSDRQGLTDDEVARSWNSTHLTRGGCSQDALKSTGGAGLFYCFAAN
jgi:hypothetical protein